jgi:hypothetical protein
LRSEVRIHSIHRLRLPNGASGLLQYSLRLSRDGDIVRGSNLHIRLVRANLRSEKSALRTSIRH